MLSPSILNCACLLTVVGTSLRGGEAVSGSGSTAGERSRALLELERKAGADLEIRIELWPIRTAVYLSYRKIGIGRVEVTNRSRERCEGLLLRVDLPGREDLLPEAVERKLGSLEPGKSETVEIRPRFSPSILEEPTAEVRVRARLYLPGGIGVERPAGESSRLVPLVDRSCVTWDQPERIAPLVNPEPLARFLRGEIAPRPAGGPAEGDRAALPIRNLELAGAIFDSLAARGLRYLEDPPSSTASFLLGRPADRVNLPMETLRDRGGDCDDLSILLASALEAVGVPTALAIAQEHVFVLFDLGLRAEGLEAAGLEPAALFERGARAWVPVEATRLARPEATLLEAWNDARPRLGALRSGAIRILEIRTAWMDFPAIGPLAAPRRGLNDRPLNRPPDEAAERSETGGASSGDASPTRPSGRSGREISRLIRREIDRRAEAARAEAARTSSPADGELRAAAVYASAGYRFEAKAILRHLLRVDGAQVDGAQVDGARVDGARAGDRAGRLDPGIHVELARLILADSRTAEIDEARRELEEALRSLDPMDLAARGECQRDLARAHRLLGNAHAAAEAEEAARRILGAESGEETLALAGGGASPLPAQ